MVNCFRFLGTRTKDLHLLQPLYYTYAWVITKLYLKPQLTLYVCAACPAEANLLNTHHPLGRFLNYS